MPKISPENHALLLQISRIFPYDIYALSTTLRCLVRLVDPVTLPELTYSKVLYLRNSQAKDASVITNSYSTIYRMYIEQHEAGWWSSDRKRKNRLSIAWRRTD